MSDGEIRALERRFRETGAHADGMRLLLARLRAGRTEAPQLDLAAFLGSPEAASAHASLGGPTRRSNAADRAPAKSVDVGALDGALNNFVLVLAEWGWEPLLRAAIACAQLQLQHQVHDETRRALLDEALGAAVAFLREPGVETSDAARRRAARCAEVYQRSVGRGPSNSPAAQDARRTLGAPWFAAAAAGQDWRLGADETVPCEANVAWRYRCAEWPQRAAIAAAMWVGHAITQTAIEAAIAAWANGERDPFDAPARRADPRDLAHPGGDIGGLGINRLQR